MNTEDSEFERIAREQAMREEYKSAIEVSVVFHEGMKMFAVPVQPARQCKWPTCQSEEYQQALAEQIKRELVGEHPVAWHTEDHLTDRSATTYNKAMVYRWQSKGWPVTPLYTIKETT